MKASLIISVYKDVEALEAILRSLDCQTELDFEVIVAQDAKVNCFNEAITAFIQKGYKITLLQQEDDGFQKNKILNRAIVASTTEKLIFIDGDCVLHPAFIEKHLECLKPNSFCAGKRVDVDQKTSLKMRKGEMVTPTFFQLLFNGSNRIEETFRFLIPFKGNSKTSLLGCNMSWNKADLIKLNGFDEDYVNPGYGEDVDIEFRAELLGLQKINTRYRTIQYHLFHERPQREDQVVLSHILFCGKRENGNYRCENGIVKEQSK